MYTSRLEYRGTSITIRYCEEPPADADLSVWISPSLQEALEHIPPKKRDGCVAKMVARREQLANQGRLRSPDYLETEDNLPNGKHFYAIKVDRLRAYGWFSSRHKGVFYISHFAFKKGQKLAQKDTDRVIRNWRHIEEQ
jgi:hypothetical protein